MRHPKTETTLASLAKKLAASRVRLPIALKLRVAEIVLNLMAHGKRFGLFIILGWKSPWNNSTDISDRLQDIFLRHRINIMDKGAPMRRYAIAGTINYDGAILIDGRGNVLHSGVMIEGMRPRSVAEKLRPGKFADLSAQFGFKEQVHTRHLTAIAASYDFKNTTAFTVSEETGAFHVFEGGKIVFSCRYGDKKA